VKVIDPNLDIGDTVTIIDHDYNPALYLQARVATLEKSYTDATKGSITFTNYVVLTDTVTQQIAALRSKVNGIKNGSTSYVWIRYADDDQGTNMSMSPKDKTYVAIVAKVNQPVPSDDPNDYAGHWQRLTGEQGIQGLQGNDGKQGIPGKDGKDGSNGVSTYVHMAYANSADGATGFNLAYFTNAQYIGLLTDTNQADSTDYKQYTWSRLRGTDGTNGTDGTPGAKGADGRTPYFHVAYSNSADGATDFTVQNPSGKQYAYMGTYVDYTQADSTEPTTYSWSLVKGPQGNPGQDGSDGVPGEKGIDGKTSYFHTAWADSDDGKDGFYVGGNQNLLRDTRSFSDKSAWQSFLGTSSNGEYHFASPVATEYLDFLQQEVTLESNTTYTYSFYAKGNTNFASFIYNTGTTNAYADNYHNFNLTADYQKFTITFTTGNPMSDKTQRVLFRKNSFDNEAIDITIKEMKLEKGSIATPWVPAVEDNIEPKYIGTYTDFTQADSLDPTMYMWSQFKGDDGSQGIPGVNGTSSYTHIAYADDNKGTGFSQEPGTKKYMGMYVDTTQADSTDVTKYGWSLIKGTDGTNGTPGAAGADGKTPYFHVAYATSADGKTGFSTSDATNKTYLGTFTDYTEADSTDPTKYTWSLTKGANGIDGSDGKDGANAYLHIAYANSVDGKTDFTTDETQAHNRDYLGTYSDATAAQSTDPTKYTWQLTRGAQGLQGQPGSKDVPVVTMSSTAPVSPKDGDFWYQTTTDSSGQKITDFSVYSGGKWAPSKIDQSTLVLTKLVSVEIDSATINSPDITVPFDYFDESQNEYKGSMEFKDGMLKHISTMTGGDMLKTVVSPTGYTLDAYANQSEYTKNNPYIHTEVYADNISLSNANTKKSGILDSSGIGGTLNNGTDQSTNVSISWEDVQKYLSEMSDTGSTRAFDWFDIMSSVQSHPNLVRNSSFINGQTNWDGFGTQTYMANVTHDGNFAVCIESAGGGNFISQDLSHIPDPGHKLCVSYWGNIDRDDGGFNGGMLISFQGVDSNYTCNIDTVNPSRVHGWRFYMYDPITVPNGTTGIRISFYNNEHNGNKIYYAQPMISDGDVRAPYMPTY
jgi:hypothetical protein